jgi:hypothetical protein
MEFLSRLDRPGRRDEPEDGPPQDANVAEMKELSMKFASSNADSKSIISRT